MILKKILDKWNIKITSENYIKPKSNIKVRCNCPKCLRDWDTTIEYLTRKKDNICPYCNNRRVCIGDNDLATTYPQLAKQWHPSKNGELKPTDVVAGSNKKVWWRCENGHEWQADIFSRTRLYRGYPKCSKLKR